jgi:hypothetical protein
MEWSREEVEAIVADYLQMLTLELAGQRFNKSARRRALLPKLDGRSEASVEFKHCNITAVLQDLGIPPLFGYKGRANYQALLFDVVVSQLSQPSILDEAALAAVERPAVEPPQVDFAKVKSEAPPREHRVAEVLHPGAFVGVKRDYLEREARNRSLGAAGEEFVVHFEHWRLIQFGQKRLADRVEHVSSSKGDGLGYDVLSFDADGRERYIEVKTTSFGSDTPFFVSQRELALSRHEQTQFHLYRLFEFRKAPRMFDLVGNLAQHCQLDPVSYRAAFN